MMEKHLAAVADRALIQTTPGRKRELRDVLDHYRSDGLGDMTHAGRVQRKRT
jgi:hypothetical protein